MRPYLFFPAIFFLAALALAGCKAGEAPFVSGASAGDAVENNVSSEAVSPDASTSVWAASGYDTPASFPTTMYAPSAPKDAELILPDRIVLEEIGDTYQLAPESKGVALPEYTYLSELPYEITVDETGLVTLHTNAVAYVYVTLIDKESGKPVVTKAVQVVSGAAIVPVPSSV